jgi:hypothetical protein
LARALVSSRIAAGARVTQPQTARPDRHYPAAVPHQACGIDLQAAQCGTADLQRAASGGNEATYCLSRMQDGSMPPGGGVSAADIGTFATWVGAGAQGVPCGGMGGMGGAADAGGDPFGTPSVCTSGAKWSGGNQGSSRMNPGQACIACHQKLGGPFPPMTIGGTVYPTAHEPNNCNGASGAVVVVEDANHQQVFTMTTNSAGNFRSSQPLPAGYFVKVTANGKERAMMTSPPSGDCNSCHTETGANGAPGRIMAP